MFHLRPLLIAASVPLMLLVSTAPRAQESQRGPLDGIERAFGLAVDPNEPDAVVLGTEYGLLRARPDGMAEVLPQVKLAVFGLTALPDTPRALALSGYGEDGTPGGLLLSTDGGKTWHVRSGTGGEGGIAVTSLSISRANPKRMAGLAKSIMLSDDGGTTWREATETPKDIFAVSTSGIRETRLYAATMNGLKISDDGGQSWIDSALTDVPVTTVTTLGGGRLAAFAYGVGFIVTDEANPDWTPTGADFLDRYLRVITEAPDGTLYAIADTAAVLLSRDSGKNWTSFEGSHLASPERIAAGRALFQENCQACHGVGGIGEDPENPGAKDEFGFKAPALNDAMHAWHHSDANLRATIHKGSPRNARMIAWEDQLSDDEIDSILAYIKSTWNIRSLACQGGRHMSCMGN